jgi:hypothetical protein
MPSSRATDILPKTSSKDPGDVRTVFLEQTVEDVRLDERAGKPFENEPLHPV